MVNDNNNFMMGARTGNRSWLAPYSATNNMRIGMNSGSINAANVNAQGMHIISRNSAANVAAYRNKASIFNGALATIAIPTVNVYSLCYNNSGAATSFTDNQVSMVFIGGSLNQTDVDNLTDRFETRMDFHGTGVIP